MFVPIASILEGGAVQLIIVLVIALLFFGHKLPSVARSLGSSVNEFKKGFKEGEQDENAAEGDALKKDAKDNTPEKK